jgi:hypothetical protein
LNSFYFGCNKFYYKRLVVLLILLTLSLYLHIFIYECDKPLAFSFYIFENWGVLDEFILIFKSSSTFSYMERF